MDPAIKADAVKAQTREFENHTMSTEHKTRVSAYFAGSNRPRLATLAKLGILATVYVLALTAGCLWRTFNSLFHKMTAPLKD